MKDNLLKNLTTVIFFSGLTAMALLFAGKSTRLQSRISTLQGMNSVLEERNAELGPVASPRRPPCHHGKRLNPAPQKH